MTNIKTFDELYPQIEKVVEGFRSKWKFKASVEKDFDDIKSEILVHIWQKWDQYDQSRSVEGWVSTITHNQFINKLRDIYLKTSSPCNRCAANLGNGLCSQFGAQGVECPLFAKWYGKKRYSHEAKMPLAIDLHINEVENSVCDYFDYDLAIKKLHDKMKIVLTKNEYQVYTGLYIEGKDDDVVSSECGFKKDSKSKRVRQIKAVILKKAKKLLAEGGVELNG